jgi:hypothetical protein
MSSEQIEQGACTCGAIRFHFDRSAVVGSNHCHCRDCQRSTGSAFATFCMVPEAAFELEQGTPRSYSVDGESGKGVTRSFCGDCGSQLYSTVGVMPGFLFVKAGVLDDASWMEPASDFWASSAQPWVKPLTGVVHERNPG